MHQSIVTSASNTRDIYSLKSTESESVSQPSDLAIQAWAEMQCLGMLALNSSLYDTYIESVLSVPMAVVNISVHGVRLVEHREKNDTYPDGGVYEVSNDAEVRIDDDNPDFYSVYVELADGNHHCVGDFGLPGWASEFASKQARRLGCSVHNHLQNRMI